MEEIFKKISDIPGFEGFEKYEVSNKGRVKSFHYCKQGRILAPTARWGNGKEYLRVGIRCSLTGVRRSFNIHRLVALAFLYNENHLTLTVDHLDNDSFNNCVSNLQWLTAADNIRKNQSGIRKVNAEEVAKEYLSGKDIKLQDLADKYGCSVETIWRAVNSSEMYNLKKRKKFSRETRISIAKAYLSGKTLKQVGSEFDCCQSQVSSIVKQYLSGSLSETT